MSSHRNSSHSGNRSETSFLNMSLGQLNATLNAQKKSPEEKERIIESVKAQKDKVRRVIQKFRKKVEKKYGILDEATLVKKGLAHAAQYKLSDQEKDAFIKNVLRGDTTLTHDDELRYSKMSRFLGIDNLGQQYLNLAAKDQQKLNELVSLYKANKQLYHDVKNQTYIYRDCAAEALTGVYKPDKMNISSHVHPIVAMLFLPSVKVLEDRMLRSNIGRMVLQRAPLVANKVSLYENVLPGELEAEFELAFAIAHDPNSINSFSDSAPIDNLVNRFRCQIELWKNVHKLRQGQYYSQGYDSNDGVTGLLKTLSGYDKVFYDGPDNLNPSDEGNILKKILGVFSIRPSFTQISSYSPRISMGVASLSGLSRMKFVNLPIINIRLPSDALGGGATRSVQLQHALRQTDIFIDDKMLVPKNKAVIHSKDMVFFYADRRYRTVNFAKVSLGMKSIALTPNFVGSTSLNKTELEFGDYMPIGAQSFGIRGVIVLETPMGYDIVTGCSASIVSQSDPDGGMVGPKYLCYNPYDAIIKVKQTDASGNAKYVQNAPVTWIPEYGDEECPGFRDSGRTRGCIFWYTKQ